MDVEDEPLTGPATRIASHRRVDEATGAGEVKEGGVGHRSGPATRRGKAEEEGEEADSVGRGAQDSNGGSGCPVIATAIACSGATGACILHIGRAVEATTL